MQLIFNSIMINKVMIEYVFIRIFAHTQHYCAHYLCFEPVISRKKKQDQCEDYCIVKFSIRDKVGSLVSALEVFQVDQS